MVHTTKNLQGPDHEPTGHADVLEWPVRLGLDELLHLLVHEAKLLLPRMVHSDVALPKVAL